MEDLQNTPVTAAVKRQELGSPPPKVKQLGNTVTQYQTFYNYEDYVNESTV